MQDSIGIGISLPKELMKKIDIDRGDIPRSRYVLRMLEKQYNTFEGKNVVRRGSLDRRFHTPQPGEPLTS